jgi:hypothetical protein
MRCTARLSDEKQDQHAAEASGTHLRLMRATSSPRSFTMGSLARLHLMSTSFASSSEHLSAQRQQQQQQQRARDVGTSLSSPRATRARTYRAP